MNKMKLGLYKECQPYRKKMLLWRILNMVLFPILTRKGRNWLACKFGMQISKWNYFKGSVKVYAPWNLSVGNLLVGPRVKLYCKDKITIGEGVVISQDAYLCTASHDITSKTMDLVTKPIVVQDNVWIAARAVILPGVTIGEGAVVGACAVVAKDVPPWSVVVGNPARVVGKRELKED